MSRKKSRLVVANWKMNTTLADAMVLGEGVRNGVAHLKGVEVVLCPPFVWLYPLKELFRHSSDNLSLGAQNMHWEDQGAFTGEVSPVMIKDMIKYVILGHSERRFHFKETNEMINDKVKAALHHKITPILCVGEWKRADHDQSFEENIEKNETIVQMKAALSGISEADMEKIVLTYEPVWAISKGGQFKAATGEYVAEAIKMMREGLTKMYNTELAENIRIIYGGSVNAQNISEFVDNEDVDGVLVGAASLMLKEFLGVCKKVSSMPR